MDLQRKKTKQKQETLKGQELVAFMRERGWSIKKTHGNMYQSGWPDYYAYHRDYGQRWIELKTELGKLEDSQVFQFKDMMNKNVGVWIIRGKEDYNLLFKEANFNHYLTYGVKIFDRMIK